MNAEEFVKQFAWSMETFRAAAETNFCCAYCDHYFFDTVESWTQFNVDHLRPGKAGERDERVDNKVAACWTCNKLKSNYDPGEANPGASKQELIGIAKKYIVQTRKRRALKVSAMHAAVALPSKNSQAGYGT